MDWAKVDAALASALADAGDGRSLSVVVHVDPSLADDEALDRLGLTVPGTGLGTASLSAAEVARLTDERWVRRVGLSGRLRLLDDSRDPPEGLGARPD